MTAEVVDAGDGLPLTIPELLSARATANPDGSFVVCDDDRLTYAEADERSRRLAAGLLATGTSRGAHVGLLFPNCVDFVVGWLAACRIGAVALPFSTFSTATELTGLLSGADVDILLSAASYRSHDYVRRLPEAVPGMDVVGPGTVWSPEVPTLRSVAFADAGDIGDRVHPTRTIGHLLDAGAGIASAVLAAAEAEVSRADPMVVVHTSGSTSAPKGVVHCHGPLIRHLDNLNQIRSIDAEVVAFAPSPWFWIGGFAFSLLGTLVAGARLVTSAAADATSVLDVIERERPSVVNGFAQSVAHLPDDPSFERRDLSSIRRGNLWPILPDDVRPADPGLRHNMLGMTETGSVCLLSPDEVDLPEHQRGSFGRPAPGFGTRIVDPDTGTLCATGEVGELWLRGPFMMDGYLGRERHETFDADGWFHTGDLFHVDAAGLHYFHGRNGMMIKTSGANVSPLEVEAALADVAGLRAHVVGVDSADAGQVVAAAIVADAAVDLDELSELLRQQLSSYKVPKRYLVMPAEDVPMMSSGKLDIQALKTMFTEGPLR